MATVRRHLALAALALALGLAAAPARAAGPAASGLPLYEASLSRARLICEAPQTLAQRARGLLGREGLAPGRGMVFLYNPPRVAAMHMEGMRFALDFIWVAHGRVLAVTAHAQPQPVGRRRLIMPPGPVTAVVEAPAGWAEAHGVAPGAPARITPLGETP